MKKRLFLIPAVLILLLFAGCEGANKKLTIASKRFTENVLLSEIYAQLIESRTDIEVVRRQNMGTTAICFASMQQGEIDCYIEYTGTIYKEILKHGDSPQLSHDELFRFLQAEMDVKMNVAVFPTLGLNNTYALALRKDKAEAFGVKTMSDLSAAAPKLVFGANDLFYTRISDGYDTMVKEYNLSFNSIVKMNTPMLYDAVLNDQVDVIVVYATDAMLKQQDMVILEDDKQMFPEYYAVPVIEKKVLKKYPELNDVLNLLEGRINNELMQELNFLVDVEGKPLEETAADFLAEIGL